jgi:hypothetical protein
MNNCVESLIIMIIYKKSSLLTFEYISLLQLLGGGPETQTPDELGSDDTPVQPPLLVRHLETETSCLFSIGKL